MIKKLRAAVCSSKAPALYSLVLILVLGLFPGRLAAQVNAYEVEQLSGSYSVLPVGRTILSPTLGNLDAAVYNTTIGFNFVFNGITYTSVNMSINGFLTFGATPPALLEHEPLTSSAGYNGAIGVYGWDLDFSPSGTTRTISKHVEGAVGSRIAKFEWVVYRSNGNSNYAALDGQLLHMQVWLYEGTNEIDLRYNAATGFGSVQTLGQIGLRGATNADFVMLDWQAPNNDWPALPNAMAVTTTNNTARVSLRGTVNMGGSRIQAGSNRLFKFRPVSCTRPSALTATLVTENSMQLSWAAANPAPADGYEYYYTTSATAPNAATSPSGSVGAGITTAPLTGLASATTYYIYVRSVCGPGDTGSWAGPLATTTLCAPIAVPYFNYFEEDSSVDPIYDYTAPGVQMCHSVQTLSPNGWQTADAPSVLDGFVDEHLVYNGTAETADSWFFTRGIHLDAGTSYQLSYLFGGETNFNFIVNSLSVHLGTTPQIASMTTLLENHPSIKHGAQTNYRNFSVAVTGTYYVGFKAYSAGNNGRMFLDDIQLVEGMCDKPANLIVGDVSSVSATVSWTAPAPPPSNGYAYYLSTDPTPPGNNQSATNVTSPGTTVVSLTGLSGNTTYYFWVRGDCGLGDKSEWSDMISFTTLPTPPYCIPSAVNSPNYAAITLVRTTNGYTNIDNASGPSLSGYTDFTHLVVTQSVGNTISITVNMDDATAPAGISLGAGVSIFVDWNQDGSFTAAERVFTTSGYNSSPSVSTTFTVPGTAVVGMTRMRVMVDYWSTTPDGCNYGTSGSTRGETEDYSFKVSPPPPPISINIPSSTQCAGSPSSLITITSNLADFDTYTWTPATGISGDPVNGYTLTANGTMTYTLTGTQTSGQFSTNTVNFTYVANPLPTTITITANPSGPACSSGPAIALGASGGVVDGFPILTENFNTGASGWVTSASNTGGNTAAAVWTLRNSPFVPSGPSWSTTVSSPDASTFYFLDSDAQGSGSNTLARLESPVFSLAGYQSASLRFNHFFKGWTNGGGYVEISTNGGSSYTVLQSYLLFQEYGSSNNFAPVTLDLGAYLGQTNLKIRFRFQATWGWGWAIDDVLVSGSADSAITWTPTTGLYTDAAATIPYTGTGAQTVYALPSVTTTYTASASTFAPVCTTTTTHEVIVIAAGSGTVLPLAQTVCNLADDLVLTTTDVITGWEYSTTAAFTAPVAIPASASATLTGAQIGSFAGTRYYRAVLSNGTCVGYSDVVSVGFTSTTWNGTAWSNGTPHANVTAIFAGNYTSTADLNACSVVVNSGAVSFMPNHSLIVQNRVEVNAGTLTFENNASLVQVIDPASNENTGYITYKRNTMPIRTFDYTYWSSPLFPQTFVGVSPATMADKYFRFDAAAGAYVNVAGNSLMNPGQGYIIRAPQGWSTTPTVYNAVFNGGSLDGVPNNGVITTPVVSVGANSMNLVGNPYPSAIDAHALIDHPSNAHITGTLYFWTHNTPVTDYQYTGSDYAIYNYTGGVGTGTPATNAGINNSAPTRYIAAGQGFFVEGTANGPLRFDNSMRVVGTNSNFYRISAPGAAPYAMNSVEEKHRLWLVISNASGLSKQTLVGYISSATNNIDRGFDGKLADAGNPVSLYSLVDQTALSIQGRALPFDLADVVPLGYRANFSGVYQISLPQFDGLFHHQGVYLEDVQLGVVHNLKDGAYSFVSETGTFDNRFVLRYTAATLGINDSDYHNAVTVLNQNGVIQVHSGNIPMKRVEIYDVRGRLITSKSGINEVLVSFDNLGLARQVLVVKVFGHTGAVTSKKIVY